MNANSYNYHGCGLNIRSQIECPELISGNSTFPDIEIKWGKVPDSLPEIHGSSAVFQAMPNHFLLKINNIANYLIADGNSITVEPSPQADPNDVRVFLLGPAFGALLHQQGILVINGSAIVVNGESIIFSGCSGAGKSTLTAALHQSGYRAFSDELCAISFSENQAVVHREAKVIRLWEDSLVQLGLNPRAFERTRKNLKKYNYSIEQNESDVVPIKRLYFMEAEPVSDFTIETVEGMEKTSILLLSTYHRRYIDGLGIKREHFQQCNELSKRISIKKIIRPSDYFLLKELTNYVRNDLKK